MRKPYHKCIDCGKNIWGKLRCSKCFGLSHKGKNNSFYGKHHTKETKLRMSKNHANVFGKNNFAYKQGKTTKKVWCVDCGKLLNKHAYYYGTIRCRHCAQKGKRSVRFGKPANWHRVKYKNINMRSNYELLYAKYLDKNNIKWLYESKTFDLGDSTYTPDFYLPKTNKHIEIKGYFSDKAKIKFTKFKKQYPKINIEILRKEDLIQRGIL